MVVYSLTFLSCLSHRCSRVFVDEPKKIAISSTAQRLKTMPATVGKTPTATITAAGKVYSIEKQRKDATDQLQRKILGGEISKYVYRHHPSYEQ